MDILATAERYFAAWNNHDPDGVAALFAENGTYSDPVAEGPLCGPAISDYAAGLFEAFPGLSFETVGDLVVSGSVVAVRWNMKGVNSGTLRFGLPATGNTINLPGADFIEVGDDGILSVNGYFDQKTFVEQLGLQVIIQPHETGSVTFGNSVRATSGRFAAPGAVSLTWLEVKDMEEREWVSNYAQTLVSELPDIPGFIGVTLATLGRRMLTVAAWDGLPDVSTFSCSKTHRDAVDEVYEGGHLSAFYAGVYVPHNYNGPYQRCSSCAKITKAEPGEGQTEKRCECGATLPPPPPFW